MIITIDGPAGTGKSTVAKALAGHLGWYYHNTGAIYRALTGVMLTRKWIDASTSTFPLEKEQALQKLQIEVIPGQSALYLVDGEDMTSWVKDPAISLLVSRVSSWKPVREKLLETQRKLTSLGPAVFEGRDMGTTVFPQADLKFFLLASAEERAKRRLLELQQAGREAFFDEVLADIQKRDLQDTTREISPLKQPQDAHVIDTTAMSIQDVIELLYKIARDRLALKL
jgi:cytidylate kinase